MFGLLWELLSGIYYFALHVTSADAFPPPLSAKKEAELLKKSQNGDIDARNILIEHNLRLVSTSRFLVGCTNSMMFYF